MKVIITLLLLVSYLSAEDKALDRFEFLFKSGDDNKKITPEFYIPIYYSNTLYSGIGSVSKSNFSQTKLSNKDYNQNLSTATEYEKVWIDIINYKLLENNYAYTLGLSANYSKYQVIQYGYVAFNFNNELVNTDSKTEISDINVGLYADFEYQNIQDVLSFRVGTYIYPITYSTIDEVYNFANLIREDGKLTSSSYQDLRYSIFLTTQLDLFSFLSFQLDVNYEYIPSDMATLEPDYSGFKVSNYVYNTKDLETRGMLLFPTLAIYNINPSIGMGYRVIDAESVYAEGDKSSTSQNSYYYLVGFNKAF